MGIFSDLKQHPFRNLIYTPFLLQMHTAIDGVFLWQKRSQVGHLFTCEPCIVAPYSQIFADGRNLLLRFLRAYLIFISLRLP